MDRKKFIKTVGVGVLGSCVTNPLNARVFRVKNDFETCKTAWDHLCGKIGKAYDTDCFTYVHPTKKRPNVLIYGDSVSIKYTAKVRADLHGKATVIRLFKNGGSSHDFINNMNKMNQAMFHPSLEKGWSFQWDLIHFNVGLHDLKYLKGKHLNKKGTQVSSTETYKEHLDDICKYLQLTHPKAKLIFATTTPVPTGAKGRYKGDSVKYNKAALEVLKNYPQIVINDLYSYTIPNHATWMQELGNVHYNKIGFTAQGKEVARVIAEIL